MALTTAWSRAPGLTRPKEDNLMNTEEQAVTEPPMPPESGAVPNEQLEEMVARRRRARGEDGGGEEVADDAGEPRTGRALLNGAAKGELSDEESVSALDYFLSTKDDPTVEPNSEPVTLTLNVGTKKDPRKVRWSIVPVEDTEITRIRRDSVQGTRAQRRRGDADVNESLVARRIVVRGTVDPDLKGLAREMGTGPDPADAVAAFFRKVGKTGLITQISGEILSISGWDDEDVQEVDAALG